MVSNETFRATLILIYFRKVRIKEKTKKVNKKVTSGGEVGIVTSCKAQAAYSKAYFIISERLFEQRTNVATVRDSD